MVDATAPAGRSTRTSTKTWTKTWTRTWTKTWTRKGSGAILASAIARPLAHGSLKENSVVLSRQISRVLPYTAEQLFDLAADVERYPEFLQWWIKVRVRNRADDVYYTDQVLGIGPLHVEFRSKTVQCRPQRIDVTANEAPFRNFRLSWLFEPQGAGHCRATLTAELEFRSFLIERLADKAVSGGLNDIVDSFVRRAHRLYASSGRPSETDSGT
jgi:coenzyme Q-binding protein COQ10